MPRILILDIIAKKRDGEALSEAEVRDFVEGVVEGDITAAQTGAMLMAIYLNGMNDRETSTLTTTMLRSGEILQWEPEWKGTIVDKHSTGGVGEKSSLILAPALAACGLRIPMISGRGLGHTGGTLDKLESIPGLKTDFTLNEMHDILGATGIFIVSPTKKMVPADKILYATRDITSTVANKSLITASIMSKKAAESLDALVLQLTFGKAAFMKSKEDAQSLGRVLINTGHLQGIKTTGILMRMDDPLGRAVGNSLEVLEAIQCLKGNGPSDLHEVVCKMGGQLLLSTGRVQTIQEGEAVIDKVIQDGSAKKKFIEMAIAQGAHAKQMDQLFTSDDEARKILPTSKHVSNLLTKESGYVQDIDALTCANLAHQLGAGRSHPEDKINPGVGVVLKLQVGDYADEGDVWTEIHHDSPLTNDQVTMIQSALIIGDQPPPDERLNKIVDVLH